MDWVRIFDTTLRDGEQSPGFSMNTAEKIRMARQLAKLGVDVIEAGFPIASRGDLDAVRLVAKEVRRCQLRHWRERGKMTSPLRLKHWSPLPPRGCTFFWLPRICTFASNSIY